MNEPSSELQERLLQAAELRAKGGSWEAVAELVGEPEQVCSGWPALYPSLWRRLFRAARRRMKQECRAEAQHTLRTLLRSAQEQTRLAAAQALLKALAITKAEPAPSVDTDLAEYAREVRGYSDEQLEHALRKALGEFDRDSGDAPATSPERSE